MNKNIPWLLAVLLLVGCASEPMVSDADVVAAEQSGELTALYQQLSDELLVSKPNSPAEKNRQNYIDIVGLKIAQTKAQAILEKLDHDVEKQTITNLEFALAEASEIERYNADVFQTLNADLQKALDEKRIEVAEKEQQFASLADDKASLKVQLLDQMAAIYGGHKAREISQQRTDYIAELYQKADELLAQQKVEEARVYYLQLKRIDANHPDLEPLRYALIIAEFEPQFWLALSKGHTDLAFSTFKELLAVPDYLAKYPAIVPAAEEMARYFIAEGNKYLGSFALSSAYQSFSRARFVKTALGDAQNYAEAETKFIDLLARRLQSHVEKNETIPAYGFASILEEMQPSHELLTQHAENINAGLLADAQVKVVLAQFSSKNQPVDLSGNLKQDFQQQLTPLLENTAQLFNDVEISQAAAAKKINAANYYFINATIVDSGTRLAEISAEENRSVMVSYQTVENPEYLAWQKLKKREKKRQAEPVMMIDVPVEETVTLQRTLLEKEAYLSINYQVVSAFTAQPVLEDTLQQAEIFTAEIYQAFERGLFKVEPQVPELPSDEDVLQHLSLSVAKEAAAKIAETAALLQQDLLKLADMQVVAEEFNQAATLYAYSDVLLRAEGKVDAELAEKLRIYAIRWKN